MMGKWRKGVTRGRKRTVRSQVMRKLKAANRKRDTHASERDENHESPEAFLESDSTPTLVTNINAFTDLLLESVQQNASIYGLNPYEMATVTNTLQVGLFSGELILSNGKIYGANTVYRYADAIAAMSNNESVTATLVLGFKNITYIVDYSVTVGFASNEGEAHGVINDVLAKIVLVANLKNTSDVTAVIKSLDIYSVGVVTAHVDTNNVMTEAVSNAVAAVLLTFFKDQVVHGFQDDMATALNTTMVGIHFNFSG